MNVVMTPWDYLNIYFDALFHLLELKFERRLPVNRLRIEKDIEEEDFIKSFGFQPVEFEKIPGEQATLHVSKIENLRHIQIVIIYLAQQMITEWSQQKNRQKAS